MTETYRAKCEDCGKIQPHYVETEKCTFCASEEGERMLLETRMARAAKKAAKKKAQRKKKTTKKKKKVKKQPQTVTSSPEIEELSEAEKAKQEVARRALAKRHLLAFVKRYEPNYKAGWVHKVLCEELMKFSEAVVRGESPRLMITTGSERRRARSTRRSPESTVRDVPATSNASASP